MNVKRLITIQVVAIIVIILAFITGYYFYYQGHNYIKTNDAQVSGQQIVIAAPAAGKLTQWNASVGTQFNTGACVGTVEVPLAKGVMDVSVADPQASTIVQNVAVNNEFVAAGTPLAYAYDLSHLWITAYVKETQLKDVKVGQKVDVYVDADGNTTYTGVVKQIGLTTAAELSPLPSGNTDADYTKVTQVVPVTITLPSGETNLAPGMSATVRIHK